jgi:ABC-type glycerol-3-phosphate transport system permease component
MLGAHTMRTTKSGLLYLVLTLVLMALAVPFLWMVSASFKEQFEIFRSPPTFIPENPIIQNYVRLFTEFNFPRHFLNSIQIAIISTVGQVFLCSLAGYAFAKYDFPLKNALFLILLGSMMVPLYTVFVPLFQLVIKMRLIDNRIAIVLPNLVSAFGIFLMRQHMESVPDELLDAGRIDGTSEFSAFYQIALPLVRPGLTVLALLAFLGSWNDYVWPLIIIRTRELQTLPVMLAGLVGMYRMEHGILMAGAFLSALPVLILFGAMQRYFVSGMLQGALRG